MALWNENKNKIFHHLESSVNTLRNKSLIEVRNISESPNNKFISTKMRSNKIPWKIEKKELTRSYVMK